MFMVFFSINCMKKMNFLTIILENSFTRLALMREEKSYLFNENNDYKQWNSHYSCFFFPLCRSGKNTINWRQEKPDCMASSALSLHTKWCIICHGAFTCLVVTHPRTTLLPPRFVSSQFFLCQPRWLDVLVQGIRGCSSLVEGS